MQPNTIAVETLIKLLIDLPPGMPVAVSLGDSLYAIWDEHVGHPTSITFWDDHDNSTMMQVAIIGLTGLPLGLAR